MSRYVDAEYVKAVMLNDRLMQGNAEYELYKQKVDAQVKALPSIDLVLCRECKHYVGEGKYCQLDRHCTADDFCSYGCRSEKPNNCEYVENPSGDAWECGCFLDTYCEHQIYDRNPDGTINIVECGYEPKDEPQTEREGE